MADFRVHSVALNLVEVPPTFRVHNIALDTAPAPVEREFHVHSIFLTRGFEPPVTAGATRVFWGGQWVESITRVRYGGAWI